MKLPRLLLVSLALLLPTISALSNLTLTLPSTPIYPNPSLLPPSTHATLYRRNTTYTALLTKRNTFDFTSLTPGSYLLTIHCRDLSFAPLRVDIDPPQSEGEIQHGGPDRIRVWQTFLGNAWGNKGELRGESAVGRLGVEVRPERVKNYYQERAGFSPLDLVKNPMILIGLVSLVLIIGMPYLIDSMDEETKEEFEQMQSKSPLTQASNPTSLANFDFASWMAGKPQESAGAGEGASGGEGAKGVDLRKRG